MKMDLLQIFLNEWNSRTSESWAKAKEGKFFSLPRNGNWKLSEMWAILIFNSSSIDFFAQPLVLCCKMSLLNKNNNRNKDCLQVYAFSFKKINVISSPNTHRDLFFIFQFSISHTTTFLLSDCHCLSANYFNYFL